VNFESITRRLRNLRWRLRPFSWRLWFGTAGERAAARALRRVGHVVLARNYRCPGGEIDLITSDHNTLVFVEVKTRTDEEHQAALEAVGLVKWSRVERAARYYVLQHRSVAERPMRFDLVTVVWARGGKPVVEHYPDAYQPRRA